MFVLCKGNEWLLMAVGKRKNAMKYKNTNKSLLILDLDETLIHARTTPLNRQEDAKIFHFYMYKRPFVDAFLAFAKEHFYVAVWSSASDDYVAEVVAATFPNEYPLEFVWGRSRCTTRSKRYEEHFGRYMDDYSNPHVYLKRLQKIKRHGFSLERTLIVDDSPEKCTCNYGNAIYSTAYVGAMDDEELPLLEKYLTTLKDIKNVRAIEKRGWQSFSG